jgi:hypothetical protein
VSSAVQPKTSPPALSQRQTVLWGLQRKRASIPRLSERCSPASRAGATTWIAGASGEEQPTPYDHIGISRIELDPVAKAASHFGRDQPRSWKRCSGRWGKRSRTVRAGHRRWVDGLHPPARQGPTCRSGAARLPARDGAARGCGLYPQFRFAGARRKAWIAMSVTRPPDGLLASCRTNPNPVL